MAAWNSLSKSFILIIAMLFCIARVGQSACAKPETVLVDPWPAEWEAVLFQSGNLVATLKSVELRFHEGESLRNKKGKIVRSYVPELVPIVILAGVDREISSQIGAAVDSNIPNNCNTRRSYHGANIATQGGRLKVDAGLRVEVWTCTIYDWLCCKAWPPSCWTCRQSIEIKVLQVDPSVRGEVWLQPTADQRGVEITADLKFDDNLSQDERNLIQGVAAVLGGTIGGSLGSLAGGILVGKELDRYSNIGFRGPFQRFDKNFSTPTTGQLLVTSATIEDRDGQRVAVLSQKGEGTISESSATELCSYFAVKRANAQRKAQGITSVTVAAGETLWSIAERLYGDGKYYQVLEYANPEIPTPLQPGAVLLVPEIDPLDQDPSVVRNGDSLWAMAERLYGDGSQYPRLLERSQGKISDPDEILPLWLLKIPETPPVQQPPG